MLTHSDDAITRLSDLAHVGSLLDCRQKMWDLPLGGPDFDDWIDQARRADNLLDHLAELECRLAGLPPLPDRWHGRMVTTDADWARFTEIDLDEATSRLTRLAACYRARLGNSIR